MALGPTRSHQPVIYMAAVQSLILAQTRTGTVLPLPVWHRESKLKIWQRNQTECLATEKPN